MRLERERSELLKKEAKLLAVSLFCCNFAALKSSKRNKTMETATLVKPNEKGYEQRNLTVEEAYNMVCDELKAIYDIKDAV